MIACELELNDSGKEKHPFKKKHLAKQGSGMGSHLPGGEEILVEPHQKSPAETNETTFHLLLVLLQFQQHLIHPELSSMVSQQLRIV